MDLAPPYIFFLFEKPFCSDKHHNREEKTVTTLFHADFKHWCSDVHQDLKNSMPKLKLAKDLILS